MKCFGLSANPHKSWCRSWGTLCSRLDRGPSHVCACASMCVCLNYTRYWGLTWKGLKRRKGPYTILDTFRGFFLGAQWVFLENLQYEPPWRPSTFLYRTLLSRHLTDRDRKSEVKTVAAHWGTDRHTTHHPPWTCAQCVTCLISTLKDMQTQSHQSCENAAGLCLTWPDVWQASAPLWDVLFLCMLDWISSVCTVCGQAQHICKNKLYTYKIINNLPTLPNKQSRPFVLII